MTVLDYIVIFTLLGSVGSLAGGLILLSNQKIALRVSHLLASFAAGTLLGTAFFDLLPEASHEAEKLNINIFFWSLIGMIIFFLLERFIQLFHHHEEYHEHDEQVKATLPLIIIGDTVHNFLDGIVIAATFLVNIPLGIITTIAVAAHEIPQEIGDFGLMLHKGMSRKNVVTINVLSALASLVGAVLTYLAGDMVEQYVPVFLALTAGFFIYIAASDLIPEIHHEKKRSVALLQTGLLLAGILLVWIAVVTSGV